MTEMKRILGRKDTGQTVPDCLDGKVTHGDILQKFKECYEELYNSAESEDATALIKVKLENMVKSDTPGSIHETQKVTGRVVKEACMLCATATLFSDCQAQTSGEGAGGRVGLL